MIKKSSGRETADMNKTSKIYVAGHRGMVGSAVVRALRAKGFDNIIVRTRSELDLTNQVAVREFYAAEKPDVAIIAAARVGGIHANSSYPAEFMTETLVTPQNSIGLAHHEDAQRLLFLGSTCIYPKFAEQPNKEGSLLTCPL